MNEYWSTVLLTSSYLSFLGGAAAAIWLGIMAFQESDWRAWVGSVMCTIIAVLSISYFAVGI